MKQSDPLELLDAGTLARPGPIGRIARLILGLLCLFAVSGIIQSWPSTTDQPASTLDSRYLLLLFPLCAFNYVVNIGFGKSWSYWTLVLSAIVLAATAIGALLATGSFDSPLLGFPLNVWLGYFYAHLGFAFVLAVVMATPGCEMRSIPQLLGRVRGKPSNEHPCPAAFISGLDAWERRKRSSA